MDLAELTQSTFWATKMADDNSKPERICWACQSNLRDPKQKICIECKSWQSFPRKYFNLSSTTLAILAAFIGISTTFLTLYQNYRDKSQIDIHIAATGTTGDNVNVSLQNFSKYRVILGDRANCISEKSEKHLQLNLPTRFKPLPAFMQEAQDKYFIRADANQFTVGTSYDCIVSVENENGYQTDEKFTFQASNT